MYKIGELCRRCGVTPRTVRYYEEYGLLHPVVKSGSAHKYYQTEAIDLVKGVKILQDLGYSLKAIKQVLTLSKSRKTRDKWLTLKLRAELTRQHQGLTRKIKNLQRMNKNIHQLLQETERCPECASTDCAACPRLEKLRSLTII